MLIQQYWTDISRLNCYCWGKALVTFPDIPIYPPGFSGSLLDSKVISRSPGFDVNLQAMEFRSAIGKCRPDCQPIGILPGQKIAELHALWREIWFKGKRSKKNSGLWIFHLLMQNKCSCCHYFLLFVTNFNRSHFDTVTWITHACDARAVRSEYRWPLTLHAALYNGWRRS